MKIMKIIIQKPILYQMKINKKAKILFKVKNIKILVNKLVKTMVIMHLVNLVIPHNKVKIMLTIIILILIIMIVV